MVLEVFTSPVVELTPRFHHNVLLSKIMLGKGPLLVCPLGYPRCNIAFIQVSDEAIPGPPLHHRYFPDIQSISLQV